jgi:hypothetical protein
MGDRPRITIKPRSRRLFRIFTLPQDESDWYPQDRINSLPYVDPNRTFDGNPHCKPESSLIVKRLSG